MILRKSQLLLCSWLLFSFKFIARDLEDLEDLRYLEA